MSRTTDGAVVPPPAKKRRIMTTMTKPKNKKQCFKKEWLQIDDFKNWLTPAPENNYVARCRACKVEFPADLSIIKQHAKGVKHSKKMKAIPFLHRPIIETVIKTEKNDDTLKNKTEEAQIKLCEFFAENNISFSLMEKFDKVLKEAFPDSEIIKKISMQQTQATIVMKNLISDAEKDRLAKLLQFTSFSIVLEKAQDIGSIKNICVTVKHFDKEKNQIKSSFWDVCPANAVTETAEAEQKENIFNSLKNSFTSRNIPLNNVIGFAFDDCSIMMEYYSFIANKMRALCPNVSVSKNVCRSLSLCLSEACEKMPENCKELANDLFAFFSKKTCDLPQFQKFADFHIENEKLLLLSSSNVVTGILELWPALLIFFKEKATKEKLAAADPIYKNLNDPFVKVYYIFLAWALPKLDNIQKHYNSERIIILDLDKIMRDTLKELLFCYMEKSHILKTKLEYVNPKDNTKFLKTRSVYLGVNVQEELNQVVYRSNAEELDKFYSKSTEFLSTMCVELKKRYAFGNCVMPLLVNLKPSMATNAYKQCDSLVPILRLLPRLTEKDKWQIIDDQWRNLPHFNFPENTISDCVDEFWGKVLVIKSQSGDLVFHDLAKFVLNILTLPHSSA
ncbi:PREDICTED: uncharacterized protein LOC108563513 [Nicrophorus vespilloides]|uniref:Uncharacterized protein LOC108563513 n=1 Tax=Nicrophorus vespilloides TaxID=110193 RepID=A0ABM1MSZ5_NICVS|nr:PREDICTED: uncharacterized protein LOC108563513 [Nicrophorus vespilloides]XP_017777695.1 PREDICTED: uncharacterized protein LOC108563513 [Nicrophorus vespilloides]